MELLFDGKVSIIQDNEELEIRIKAPKNWFLIIFFGVYLLGLSIGLIPSIYAFLKDLNLVALFIFIPFSLFYLFFLRIFLWNLTGLEILRFQNGQFLFKRKNALFAKQERFNLSEVKEFWVEQEKKSPLLLLYFKRKYLSIKSFGLIRFYFDGKLVKFGASLNEREANYIVSFLKEKNILKNY
ncbi:MAG: hypothetical protein WC716_02725 [Chitinophagaceae bacterium]|jgi:hypothetical protein